MSIAKNEVLNRVLETAQSQGADADVMMTEEQSLGLKADRGELSEYKVTSSRAIGVRVVKDEHVGTSYSESMASESLDLMVRTALENARYAKEDAHQRICAQKQTIPDWSERTSKTDAATTDEKVALALSLESGLAGRSVAAKAPYNGFSEVQYEMSVANSLGHRCSHRERTLSCYTYALLESEDQQAMHLGYQLGRTFAELDGQVCVEEAYNTARDLLAGKPVSTGSYDIIFDIDCLSEIFAAFGMCWSGESAMKGINPLRDKIGKAIAHSAFSMCDKPDVEGGFALRAFDAEGFATRPVPLVDEGVLSGFLHNSKTASFFKLPNTASAARGTKGALSVGLRHLCIAAGKDRESSCQAGTYLELVDLQGIHSGANAISGDFSFGASGFLCRDGERLQPVRGITVAGNFYQLLNRMVAMGERVYADHGHAFFAPIIRFADLSVAGS